MKSVTKWKRVIPDNNYEVSHKKEESDPDNNYEVSMREEESNSRQ